MTPYARQLSTPQEVTVAALYDELTKIAVSVQQLQGLAKRIPTIRTHTRPGTRKAMQGAAGAMTDVRQMSNAAGLSALAKPSQAKKMVDASAQFLEPEALGALRAENVGMAKKIGGNVLMPGGGMVGQMQRTSKALPEEAGSLATRGLSGAGKKALNLVGVGHEAAELTTPAKYVAPFASHMSPDVLVREHNILSTLSGKGAGEARKYMRGMRDTSGEAGAMKELFQKRFGDRGAEFLGEGQKVPKAMRKRFGEWAGSGQMMKEMTEG